MSAPAAQNIRVNKRRALKAMGELHRSRELHLYSGKIRHDAKIDALVAKVKFALRAEWCEVPLALGATKAEMKGSILVMQKFQPCL